MKRNVRILTYCSVLLCSSFASMADLVAQSAVEQKVLKDIRSSRQDLSQLKEEVNGERARLVTEVDKLELEAARLLKELRGQDASDEAQEALIRVMKRNNETDKEVFRYIISTFKTVSDVLASRIHSSQQQVYGDQLHGIDTSAGAVPQGDEQGVMAERMKSIDLAFEYLDGCMGGHVFEGQAVSKKGVIHSGRFLVLGPLGYFTANDGKLVGQVEPVSNTDTGKPVIYSFTGDQSESVSAVINDGRGFIPVDSSLGKAMQMARTKETVAEHVAKGGVVGYCIIGIGLLSLLIAVYKLFEIKRFRVPSMREINQILDDLVNGENDSAKGRAERISGLSGEMVQKGVAFFHSKRGVLEEVMYEKIVAMRPRMDRFLPFLAVTAAAAPLMGLLGTVMGMIKTFKLISVLGTGNAKNLSSGISEALVTTELGLVVAIPVLIIHGFLKRMSRGRIGAVESAALALLNGKAELIEQRVDKQAEEDEPDIQDGGDHDASSEVIDTDDAVLSPA